MGCRFYTFPSYIENTSFGISCDALANMKVCVCVCVCPGGSGSRPMFIHDVNRKHSHDTNPWLRNISRPIMIE